MLLISAGFAAKGLPDRSRIVGIHQTDENRGLAFSAGGDPTALTVPSLLRGLVPDLVGFSTGDHPAELCYGPLCHPYLHWPTDRLNAAQSGALAINLERQASYLHAAMLADPRVDLHHHFKLLSLFVGANDLCAACPAAAHEAVADSDKATAGFLDPADKFEAAVRLAVDSVRRNIPRTVLNLMLLPNISQTWDLTHDDPWCAKLRASGLVYE
ncbi:hypothetical protein HK405_008981, partial [Cladochytrium tenue]